MRRGYKYGLADNSFLWDHSEPDEADAKTFPFAYGVERGKNETFSAGFIPIGNSHFTQQLISLGIDHKGQLIYFLYQIRFPDLVRTQAQ